MRKPPQVAPERRLALPSASRAALMSLARLMAEQEAARIMGDLNDPVGDLRASQQRSAKP